MLTYLTDGRDTDFLGTVSCFTSSIVYWHMAFLRVIISLNPYCHIYLEVNITYSFTFEQDVTKAFAGHSLKASNLCDAF